jgi:hypothetical protein
MYYAWQGH